MLCEREREKKKEKPQFCVGLILFCTKKRSFSKSGAMLILSPGGLTNISRDWQKQIRWNKLYFKAKRLWKTLNSCRSNWRIFTCTIFFETRCILLTFFFSLVFCFVFFSVFIFVFCFVLFCFLLLFVCLFVCFSLSSFYFFRLIPK